MEKPSSCVSANFYSECGKYTSSFLPTTKCLWFEDYSPTKTAPTEIIYVSFLVHLYAIYPASLLGCIYNKLSFWDAVASPAESPDNLIPVFLYLCLLVCRFFIPSSSLVRAPGPKPCKNMASHTLENGPHLCV